jgi:hypothetical protein
MSEEMYACKDGRKGWMKEMYESMGWTERIFILFCVVHISHCVHIYIYKQFFLTRPISGLEVVEFFFKKGRFEVYKF